MEYLLKLIGFSSQVLDSPRTRHIAGGVLLSASMLFLGIAVTVITISNEEEYDDE
jgi:hypothetical protein